MSYIIYTFGVILVFASILGYILTRLSNYLVKLLYHQEYTRLFAISTLLGVLVIVAEFAEHFIDYVKFRTLQSSPLYEIILGSSKLFLANSVFGLLFVFMFVLVARYVWNQLVEFESDIRMMSSLLISLILGWVLNLFQGHVLDVLSPTVGVPMIH